MTYPNDDKLTWQFSERSYHFWLDNNNRKLFGYFTRVCQNSVCFQGAKLPSYMIQPKKKSKHLYVQTSTTNTDTNFSTSSVMKNLWMSCNISVFFFFIQTIFAWCSTTALREYIIYFPLIFLKLFNICFRYLYLTGHEETVRANFWQRLRNEVLKTVT